LVVNIKIIINKIDDKYAYFILKQNRFYLKTHTKSLKIKEINQENPENHFNLGIFFVVFEQNNCRLTTTAVLSQGKCENLSS
jgi:hypothetical protein